MEIKNKLTIILSMILLLVFTIGLSSISVADNNTSTFSSAIDDVGLSYHHTDTIQKVVDPNAELPEDRYENDYIYSVEETYLQKDGEEFKVDIDIVLTEIGMLLSGPPGQMNYSEAADKLNEKGYIYKGSQWTAEDAEHMRQELEELQLTIQKSDGYTIRNIPEGLAVNPHDTFTVSLNLKPVETEKPLKASFRLGSESVDFVLAETLTDAGSIANSVSWSPDGSYLATGSADNNVYIYDISTWSLTETLTDSEDSVGSVSWSPDGSQLASATNDNKVYIYDTSSWSVDDTLSAPGDNAVSVSWSNDGSHLAIGSWDENVYIYETSPWSLVETLTDAEDWIRSVSWSPDDSQLASGGNDRNAYIYDTSTWSVVETLTDAEDDVNSVSWSPDGSYFATGSDDDNVYIYDNSTWSLVETMTDAGNDVTSVSWFPDGRYLATGSFDSKVYIYETSTWSLVETLSDPGSWVRSVSWSVNGTQLAAGSNDDNVYIYDTGLLAEVEDDLIIYLIDPQNIKDTSVDLCMDISSLPGETTVYFEYYIDGQGYSTIPDTVTQPQSYCYTVDNLEPETTLQYQGFATYEEETVTTFTDFVTTLEEGETEPPEEPDIKVYTYDAENITYDGGVLRGEVEDIENEAYVWFNYKVDGLEFSTDKQLMTEDGNFTQILTGIANDTTVEFRAYAEENDYEVMGFNRFFTTLSLPTQYPNVYTQTAFNITENSMVIRGDLINFEEYAQVYFNVIIGEQSYTTPKQTLTEPDIFQHQVLNLEPETKVKWQAIAQEEVNNETRITHSGWKNASTLEAEEPPEEPPEETPEEEILGIFDTIQSNIQLILGLFIIVGMVVATAQAGVYNPFVLLIVGISGVVITTTLNLIPSIVMVYMIIGMILIIILYMTVFRGSTPEQ